QSASSCAECSSAIKVAIVVSAGCTGGWEFIAASIVFRVLHRIYKTATDQFISPNAKKIHRAIQALFVTFPQPSPLYFHSMERLQEPWNDRSRKCATHALTLYDRRDDGGGRLSRCPRARLRRGADTVGLRVSAHGLRPQRC